MKSLIASLAAVFGLAGCVAVPYYEPSGYYYDYGPVPGVSFSYSYHGGGHRHHHGHHHNRH